VTAKYPPVVLPDAAYAKALQAFCLSFDGAYEDYPWGDIVFKAGAKMFAATGPSLPVSVTVKATKEDAAFLTGLPNIEPARYVGQHGWVTVTITDDASLDHARDLIAQSYALVAPKPPRARSSKSRVS
jgi:predicted DNA-binding protein (MmcQ/YjbR family)